MYNTYIKMKKDEYILHKGLDKFKKVYLKQYFGKFLPKN